MREAFILAGLRTPLGSYHGKLGSVPAVRLAGGVARELLARTNVPPEDVDEVIIGNVLGAGLGQNPARQVAALAGVPFSSSALTIDMVCGSGLRAVCLAAQAISLGEGRVFIAGGTENMSLAPKLIAYGSSSRKAVSTVKRDGLICAFDNEPMGKAAEWLAREYGVSREEQDRYARACHRRARESVDGGLFDREIVPLARGKEGGGCERDECPWCDATLEKLAGLRPAFLKDGTVTAGNATPLADGAAAVLVCSGEYARERGAAPMARIRGSAVAGTEPRKVHLATILAVKKLLSACGISAGDVDAWELNDSFAVQAIVTLKELRLDPGRVNIRGGSLSLGHPLGASGARILVTLLHILEDNGGRYGVAGICLGGGNAVAMLVENVEKRTRS